MSKLTLSFKGKVLKVFPVLEGEMLIGSDPSCQIHIDSLAVQERHARLFSDSTRSVLTDLGSPEGTFVNQAKITEHELRDGEHIRVGKHTLTFTFEALPEGQGSIERVNVVNSLPAAQGGTRQGWLQFLSGPNLGKTISLHRSLTNLGKPGVVSAVIARRNDGYFLSHLEGDHPPQVGDVIVGDRALKLEDGDVIQIGNVKMQFYLE